MNVRGLLPLLRITPLVLGLYSITSVIAILGTLGSLHAGFMPLFLVSLAVTLVADVVALAVDRILSSRRLTSPATFFIAVVTAGLVRGVALMIGLNLIGAGPSGPGGMRVLNSVTSITVWMTLIGLFDASRELYRRRYVALLAQASTAAPMVDPGFDQHPDMLRLKSTLSSFTESSSPSAAHSDQIASAIRAEIEHSLRPLSHRIWFSSELAEPRARVGQLIHDALLSLPVPILPVIAVWLACGIAGAVSLFGFARGTLSLAISTLMLLVCLVLGRLVMRAQRRFLGPILLVACSVIPVVLTDLVIQVMGYPALMSSPVTVFLIIALGALILGGSAISLAGADRAVILALVERRVIEMRGVSGEGLQGSPSELAAFIHNSLQAELHGLALQLDSASRLRDDDQARQALERLGALANRSLSEDFRTFRESPLDRLSRVTEAWAGIAQLDVVVADGVARDDPRLSTGVRALEELIANAIRHGGARSVSAGIAISATGNLVVSLESDGLLTEALPGMGEGWLAAVSQSPVVLSGSARGSSVRLEI
ncbi:MAG: hypothetical protein RL205_1137 [Actinomycetota bacterium]